MIFRWWRNRKRKKLLRAAPSELWETTFASLPLTEELDRSESQRLLDLSRVFASEKHYEGCGGLELTERMKIVIAVQACFLILGLKHEYYRKVRTILVYPSGYKRIATTSQGGIVSEKPAHVL
ncbi:MAG: zinc-dependent peptidase, partial [Planctomycetota bacterium]